MSPTRADGMALYRYEALTPSGQVLHGEMESADQATVVAWLQQSGHIPVRAEPAASERLGFRLPRRHTQDQRIKQRDLANFTRELSVLLQAGLPLDRALKTLVDLNSDARLGALAADLQEAVRGGAALSAAMDKHRRTFPRFYVSMIEAAEAAGNLDSQLARLADYQERARALRDSVLSALLYPGILVSVAIVSLLVVLTYVVPQFSQMFADAGKTLPLPTQIVIGTADWLASYGWLLVVALAAAIVIVRLQLAKESVRLRWDAMQLRLPVVGALVKRIEMARFSRALGTLLASGVSLLASLSIVRDILTNRAVAASLDAAAVSLREGRGMADALIASGQLPALGLQMLKVGEESGRLDEVLLRMADIYDREVTLATQRMLTLLEPILIVGLGVVIAAVIMSLMLAIVSLNDLPI